MLLRRKTLVFFARCALRLALVVDAAPDFLEENIKKAVLMEKS
jgi:hypothetical protein